jgi:hypothetical protein
MHPGWRAALRQRRRGALLKAPVGEGARDPTSRCSVRIRFAVENSNGNHRHKPSPMAPMGQLQQIIGADQPYDVVSAMSLQP